MVGFKVVFNIGEGPNKANDIGLNIPNSTARAALLAAQGVELVDPCTEGLVQAFGLQPLLGRGVRRNHHPQRAIPVQQLLLALPLWALYEVGIIFASMMSKPDKNDAEAGEVSTGGPGQD